MIVEYLTNPVLRFVWRKHKLLDKHEVVIFILPVNISKESKHIVNKSIVEHFARAGLSPAMEKEMLFVEHGHKTPSMISPKDENFDQVIRRSELFEVLEEDDKKALISDLGRKDLLGGEVLYRQGNLGESIYFLAEGLLSSSIDSPDGENSENVEKFTSGAHLDAKLFSVRVPIIHSRCPN